MSKIAVRLVVMIKWLAVKWSDIDSVSLSSWEVIKKKTKKKPSSPTHRNKLVLNGMFQVPFLSNCNLLILETCVSSLGALLLDFKLNENNPSKNGQDLFFCNFFEGLWSFLEVFPTWFFLKIRYFSFPARNRGL